MHRQRPNGCPSNALDPDRRDYCAGGVRRQGALPVMLALGCYVDDMDTVTQQQLLDNDWVKKGPS